MNTTGERTILVTNDDGILADGLVRLVRAARKYGEVWVVAPDDQRSAASHGISLHKSVDVLPAPGFPVEDVRAFACSGSPADCVRVGLLNIIPKKTDLVLSGINHGFNAASDIQYSGTLGAAFEARFQGVPAIAFSEGTDPCLEVPDAYLERMLEELIPLDPGPDRVWNVNFPTCPLSDLRGILRDRKVSRSMFYKDHYNVLCTLPGGGVRLMVEGDRVREGEEGTDMGALINNYISVGTVNNVGYL